MTTKWMLMDPKMPLIKLKKEKNSAFFLPNQLKRAMMKRMMLTS